MTPQVMDAYPFRCVRTLLRIAVLFPLSLALAPNLIAKSNPEPQLKIDFRNGFWINLHHFIYLQALSANSPKKNASLEQIASDSACFPELKGDEANVWAETIAYYENNLVAKNWLFDEKMVRINNLLSGEADSKQLGNDLQPDLAKVLKQAAPLYRKYCWDKHRERNAAWIEAVQSKVGKYGDQIATRIGATYEQSWPDKPLSIDVVTYSNWAGAYTTLDPNHTTISSFASDYQGYYALEMVFHEASHLFGGVLESAIERECVAQHKQAPHDLWHALLFFNAGEITRQELAKHDISYEPYAYEFLLYKKVPMWSRYELIFQSAWMPYLAGKGKFGDAVRSTVNALP